MGEGLQLPEVVTVQSGEGFYIPPDLPPAPPPPTPPRPKKKRHMLASSLSGSFLELSKQFKCLHWL